MALTEREALLRAVLERPADDVPRLVLADWLDEHGEPDRAAFIRVQVELAKQPPGHDLRTDCRCHRCRLIRRAIHHGNLAGVWGGAGDLDVWAAEVLSWDDGRPRALVRRGFVDELRLPTAAFPPLAAGLFRRHPVMSVRLTDVTPECEDPADVPGDFAVWQRRSVQESAWPPPARAGHQHGLPDVLFDRLRGPADRTRQPVAPAPHSQAVLYWTAAEAWADLSAACVAFGRELAGLPQIGPWLPAAESSDPIHGRGPG